MLVSIDGSINFFLSSSVPRLGDKRWGDTRFVEDLAAQLQNLGHKTHFLSAHEKAPVNGPEPPIVLHVAGPHLPDPQPDAVNLVWRISHPSFCLPGVVNCYDGYFIASNPFSRRIAALTDTVVHYLPQAAGWEPNRDQTRPKPKRLERAIFVGNERKTAPRKTVHFAARAGIPFDVIGTGWADVIPKKHILEESIDPEELPDLYGSYLVGLNDHLDSMRNAGFVNNRVFDNLASGIYAISDDVKCDDPLLLKVLDRVRTSEEMAQAFGNACALSEAQYRKRQDIGQRLVNERYSFRSAAEHILATLPECIARWRARRKTGIASSLLRVAGSDDAASGRQLPPPDQFQPPEDPRDPEYALALRILRIVSMVENAPALTFTLREPAQAAPYLPLNAMTACYQDLCDMLTDADARNAQGEFSTEMKTAFSTLALKAWLFICRRSRFGAANLPTGPGSPKGLHNRMHNGLFALEGMGSNVGFDRDSQKAFVRMPPWPPSDPVPDVNVGCIVHAFYPELLPLILTRLSPIPDLALYVSTDTEEKAEQAKRIIDENGMPRADIRIVENRGRDIYPKFVAFSDVIDRHDVFLHLHTKKSPHLGQEHEWLTHILDDILTNAGQVNRVLSLFGEIPELGLLYPRAHASLGAHRWLQNRELSRALARRWGMDQLPEDGCFRFPSGSMFWARKEVLQEIRRLNLRAEDFPEENGALDGTVAHAIERLIGLVPDRLGLTSVCYTGHEDHLYRRFGTQLNNNRQFRKRAHLVMAEALGPVRFFPTSKAA